jgi:hypothetical protein
MDFTCNGLWWLPELPDIKIAGTMTFSDETGTALSLLGVLGKGGSGLERKSVPAIHGISFDWPVGDSRSEAITLKDNFVSSYSPGTPDFPRETYHVGTIFVGRHIRDFLFTRIRLRLSGLSGWAHGLTGLSRNFFPIDGRTDPKWEIYWSRPDPIRGRIADGVLSLEVGAEGFNNPRTASIWENVALSLELDKPESDVLINEKYCYPLQNFLTLATDQPNSMDELLVRIPEDKEDIRVIASRTFHKSKVAELLLPHKMIFSLQDIRPIVIETLGKWIDIYARLNSVCGPFFAIQYRPSFTVFSFLTIFQSLQVLAELRSIKAEDEGRLRQLLEDNWDIVGSLFTQDPSRAASELANMRHRAIYRDSKSNEPGFATNIYWSGQRLTFLLDACLLRELNFPPDAVKRYYFRNQRFLHLQSVK